MRTKTAKESSAEPLKADALEISWQERGSFPVKFVDGIFGEADETTAAMLKSVSGNDTPRMILVADSNVVQRTEGLGTRIGKYIQSHGITLAAPPIVLQGGEKIKTDGLQSMQKVMNAVLDAKVGRGDVMVAIGGGTLLDVAGYAASQVRGGIDIVRVPTTPSSMVGGAFSTLAMLNSANVKDAYRVPSRPVGVLIDTSFTRTVLDGVWRGGLGECIRHAAVRDGTLMKKIAKIATTLASRDNAVMDEIVRESVFSRITRGGSDFALWSSSRLEAMSAYKLPHGYAVAIGICIDCAYAVERGMLDPDAQETICRAIADVGALDGLPHSRHILTQGESVLKGLDAWKLATGSERRTICTAIGKAKTEEAADRDVYRKVLEEFIDASNAPTEKMVS